ncbi:hypothetical protein SLEP1_g34896 [Rubroshorea leprosula]|uniref:Uncharacterized protein n=1 Tax=Rubroshorea leprosula TaxID=152421 RepID=A0AAV5KLI0_9ROSI|nr:hypothetical protein SLEP1_g34896 [Rubroshorea leprosula]
MLGLKQVFCWANVLVNHSEHCSFSQPDKRKSLLLSNFEALFRIFIAGYSYRLWTNKTHSTTKRF